MVSSLSLIVLASMQAASSSPPPAITRPAPPPSRPINYAPPAPPSPRKVPSEPNLDPVPRNSSDTWVPSYEYPAKAIEEGREGSTRVRLQISQWGRVGTCTVVKSSGHSDLDEAACDSIGRRMSFEPATDANAKPTVGTIEHTVNWRLQDISERPTVYAPAPSYGGAGSLPRAPRIVGGYGWPTAREVEKFDLEPGARYRVQVLLSTSPDGEITECKVSEPSEIAALNEASCNFVDQIHTVVAALDINGNPTEGKITRTIFWRAPAKETDVTPIMAAPRARRPVSMPELGNGMTGFALEHDAQGNLISCDAKFEGDLPARLNFSDRICESAKERGVQTATNEAGEKVGRKVSVEMRFTTEKTKPAVAEE